MDEGIRSLAFHVLRVPEEIPLKYEYMWMESRLFKEGKPLLFNGLGVHVHKWFEELKMNMECLKTFTEKFKGQNFEDCIDQFMYGSLLETMRDLLVKIMRAVLGPSVRNNQHFEQMNAKLAIFLIGIDGSGAYQKPLSPKEAEKLRKQRQEQRAQRRERELLRQQDLRQQDQEKN